MIVEREIRAGMGEMKETEDEIEIGISQGETMKEPKIDTEIDIESLREDMKAEEETEDHLHSLQSHHLLQKKKGINRNTKEMTIEILMHQRIL